VLARTRAAVVATAATPLLLVGCSHPAGPGPAPVSLDFCGGGPQVRPAVVEIVCGTSDIDAGSLTWSAWGRPIATAVGTAVVDLCTYEDCHTGSFTSVPIVVIASKIMRCAKEARAYSRLQYVFVDGSPFPGLLPNVASSNSSRRRPGPFRPRIRRSASAAELGPPHTGAAAGHPGRPQVATRLEMSSVRACALARITAGSNPAASAARAASR